MRARRSVTLQPDHDASRWREVTVPTVFDRCGPGLHGYEGAGWFRRTVTVPAEWQGKQRHPELSAAVNYTAAGLGEWHAEVGRNADGFLPFALGGDACDWVRKRNVIVVRADNTRREGDVPGKQRGWRPFGGILRLVSPRRTGTDAFHFVNVLRVSVWDAERQWDLPIMVAVGEHRELMCRRCRSARSVLEASRMASPLSKPGGIDSRSRTGLSRRMGHVH
jgi:hypothetical protein